MAGRRRDGISSIPPGNFEAMRVTDRPSCGTGLDKRLGGDATR